MRCLWITRQDPFPANSGELIYSSGLVKALAEAGADVTLVGHSAPLTDPPAKQNTFDRIHVAAVGPMPDRTIRNLLASWPSDADRLRSVAMVGEIEQQLATTRFDVAVIDHAALGWAGDVVRQQQPGVRLVYVSHNCEAVVRQQVAAQCGGGLVKRTLMKRDARKYANLEQRVCRAVDLITAITPEDRTAYEAEYPDKPVIDLLPGYDIPPGNQRRYPLVPTCHDAY